MRYALFVLVGSILVGLMFGPALLERKLRAQTFQELQVTTHKLMVREAQVAALLAAYGRPTRFTLVCPQCQKVTTLEVAYKEKGED